MRNKNLFFSSTLPSNEFSISFILLLPHISNFLSLISFFSDIYSFFPHFLCIIYVPEIVICGCAINQWKLTKIGRCKKEGESYGEHSLIMFAQHLRTRYAFINVSISCLLGAEREGVFNFFSGEYQ